MTISHAIATAVNAVKKMCATGELNYPGHQKVNPVSKAEACRAVAEWEGKKAKARTNMSMSEISDADYIDLVYAPAVRTSRFDERKHLRSPLSGKFAQKFTSSQFLAARRVVEGNVANLQVGQTFKLPGDIGWVQRTPGGYIVQGPAGARVVTRVLSEAVQAAAAMIAGQISEVKPSAAPSKGR